VAAGEVLAPGSCGAVAVGGALEPGGRTAVGAVESLLTSSCFRKGAECNTPSVYILLDNEYGFKHAISVDKTDAKF
jgi:hypothetical protein